MPIQRLVHHTRPSPAPSDGATTTRLSLVRAIASALDAGDPIDALALLNARVRLRFTGIFQVDPPRLRNVLLFDRENPALNVSGGVSSLDIGYCGIVCATNTPFVTLDARLDERLENHPARHSMLSYAGVPIQMRSGIAWGTLCHFDTRPRFVSPSEIGLLEVVVPYFADWLRTHGRLS